MFGNHARQRECLARVSRRERVSSAEWLELVRSFPVDSSAPANDVFERVRDNAGGNSTCRNAVQRGGFRAGIFENLPGKIKRADHADGILVAERFDGVENILHRVVAMMSDGLLNILIERSHRADASGDAAEH